MKGNDQHLVEAERLREENGSPYEICGLSDQSLALLGHTLLYNHDQLGYDEFLGMSILVSKLREDLNKVAEYCAATEEYFYTLNNPEWNEQREQVEKLFSSSDHNY